MLLTDDLIDRIHSFRIEMMERSILARGAKYPFMAGARFGSGCAVFAGDGSPVTQVYGIGHGGSPFDLDAIDRFYKGRTENWELIVTPFACPSLLRGATAHGYVPDHFETVLAQEVTTASVDPVPGLEIEEVGADIDLWAKTAQAAWTEIDRLPDCLDETFAVLTDSPARRYLAWYEGEPAATAATVVGRQVAMLAGAATRPQFRKNGLQRALTQRRLADAGLGSVVEVVALPGSQSHRNLQRAGFQPLYSKLVLYRQPPVG